MRAASKTVRSAAAAAAAGAAVPKQLTAGTINSHLRAAEYAVRGEIVIEAMKHEAALAAGEPRPFEKVVFCNIGNPQQLGQQPITFPREVLALMNCPWLLDNEATSSLFSEESKKRARYYLSQVPGGPGAYSNSQGVPVFRQEVAEFIERRDGVASDPNKIFLTDGASPAVQMLIRTLLRDENDGIMIPIPQYPLYSAACALYGGQQVGYYLNEADSWSTHLDDLVAAFEQAKADGVNVRALAVINPGNPTGGCMSPDSIRDVIQFAVDNNLVLLADEVYQENIWASGKQFTSFKKVASDMGVIDAASDDGPLQLASFHSVSKGFLGECGRRGGYMELMGFDQEVRDQLYKLASISLCSNIEGQAMVSLMVNPPAEGTDAHAMYVGERDAILDSLKRRNEMLTAAFAEMEGVSCDPPEGALYAFPQIRLPQGVIDAAAKISRPADTYYCLELLRATGIVVVPGSGFGQRDGTFHFRTTILPSEKDIGSVVKSMQSFHKDFLARHA